MNILVLAPHPDDEVLGCGGTMAKHVKNKDTVHVLVLTRGTTRLWSNEQIEQYRAECQKANNSLGITSIHFLDFEAPELDQYPIADITASIKTFIDNLKPDAVYVPHHGDLHHDHGIITKAALVASRPIRNCTVKQVLAYETLSETEWGLPMAGNIFIPTYFVDIANELSMKIKALGCYASQLQQFPHPRSIKAIEALAHLRGSTVGCEAAEAFSLLRKIC